MSSSTHCPVVRHLIVLVPSPFDRYEDVLRRLAASGYTFERVAPHTYQYEDFCIEVTCFPVGYRADLYMHVNAIFSVDHDVPAHIYVNGVRKTVDQRGAK